MQLRTHMNKEWIQIQQSKHKLDINKNQPNKVDKYL